MGMTAIVKRIAMLMTPATCLLGVYIILHGHVTPGGGFAGGILVAGSLILLVLAFGISSVKQEINQNNAKIALSLGLILFWSVAFMGLFHGSFFQNYLKSHSASHFLSGGNIAFYDIAIGIGVSAALFTIFISFLIAKKESSTGS
ncbi:hypothetical protein JW948_10120 [bacterium]|nr:hypothetical protein [bacterium]